MNKSKRGKASKRKDGVVDLISNLPDAILVLILSRLESTEEVIRTSILSKQWRYLWTAIPSLDLHIRYGRRHKKSEFKKFVDWVLGNRSVDLVSFRLSCSNYYSMPTVERWIQATVIRNVKQLHLYFYPKDRTQDIVMPHCLVTCASLEVLSLKLQGRRLILPSFSGFPALRVLKLESVELFDDDLVKHFLEKSCPLLEDLTLEDCSVDKLDLFCISCPNLKKLTIIIYYKLEDDELCGCLKLSCPKLVSLNLDGQITSNYIFQRIYSLKEAVIHPIPKRFRTVVPVSLKEPVIDPEGNTVHWLLSGISNVESLKTELHFLYENIDVARDPALPNLKTLNLTATNATYTYKAFIQVLKNCPKLESLILKVKKAYSYGSELYDKLEFPKLDEAETRWNLTPDVKWIEFFEFNGEKPKLDISWDRNENRSKWRYVVARWGNKPRYSH